MKLSDRIGRLIQSYTLDDSLRTGELLMFPRGTFKHPEYGTLDFDDAFFDSLIESYEAKALGTTEPFIDIDHSHGAAAGWIKGLKKTDAGLIGQVEWTKLGQDLVRSKTYRFYSPWFGPYQDPESGMKYDRVLRGGALTNVPFLKVLPEVSMYEPGVDSPARRKAHRAGVTVMLSELVCAEDEREALPARVRAAFVQAVGAHAAPWVVEVGRNGVITSEASDEGPVFYRVPWREEADGRITFALDDRQRVEQSWDSVEESDKTAAEPGELEEVEISTPARLAYAIKIAREARARTLAEVTAAIRQALERTAAEAATQHDRLREFLETTRERQRDMAGRFGGSQRSRCAHSNLCDLPKGHPGEHAMLAGGAWRGIGSWPPIVQRTSPRPHALAEAISKTMAKRISYAGSPKREEMDADLFLLPKEKKYPVKDPKTGKYSPTLLRAAAARARMQDRQDLANKADAIYAREFGKAEEKTK